MADYLLEPEAEEHHGGAWKVAYADFVTALMALFIVLWLLGATPEVQRSVSSYFRGPRAHSSLNGSGVGGSGQAIPITEKTVNNLKSRLEQALRDAPDLRRLASYVQFTVTGEGLRIELMESSGGMFFEAGSPRPTPGGEKLFRLLATELGNLPNPLILEGHTDARPFRESGLDAYGNWELSFDRANMARRTMMSYGLQPERVAEIRGFGDRQPIIPDSMDSRNRRVSVVLRYEKP